jgi:hypothetical protein
MIACVRFPRERVFLFARRLSKAHACHITLPIYASADAATAPQ